MCPQESSREKTALCKALTCSLVTLIPEPPPNWKEEHAGLRMRSMSAHVKKFGSRSVWAWERGQKLRTREVIVGAHQKKIGVNIYYGTCYIKGKTSVND